MTFTEQDLHLRGHRASLLAQPPNPPPHGPRLAGPSQAPGHEVESGLALAGVAPLARVRVNLVLKVRPEGSVAGEELVVPPGQHFPRIDPA